MDFFQVIKHMQCPNPIYGMQAKGVDGADEPFDDITDMADFYLSAIKEVQPRGPYLLIGYSLGGLVTLEMAQRLRARGEEVALLAMLDSYPHMRYLVPMQRLRQHLRLAKRSASLVMKLPIRDAIAYISQRSQRRLRIPGDRNGKARYQSPSAISPVIQRVRESAYAALTRYQPRFYNGRIKFVKAEITTDFPDDPIAVWSKLARGVEVETVSGDHLEIITTHFEHLASILSRYLREAQG